LPGRSAPRQLAGWLAGWLAGLLLGWLACCLADRLAGRPPGRPPGAREQAGRHASCSISPPPAANLHCERPNEPTSVGQPLAARDGSLRTEIGPIAGALSGASASVALGSPASDADARKGRLGWPACSLLRRPRRSASAGFLAELAATLTAARPAASLCASPASERWPPADLAELRRVAAGALARGRRPAHVSRPAGQPKRLQRIASRPPPPPPPLRPTGHLLPACRPAGLIGGRPVPAPRAVLYSCAGERRRRRRRRRRSGGAPVRARLGRGHLLPGQRAAPPPLETISGRWMSMQNGKPIWRL